MPVTGGMMFHNNHKEIWDANRLNIAIQLSTDCTARCPQCIRTDSESGGLCKEEWLPIKQLTLEDIKRIFPTSILSHITAVDIGGLYGDASTSPELLDTLRYINRNSEAIVLMDTNGQGGSPDFWTRMGKTRPYRQNIRFNVDGITQGMHSKYRRGTSLETVLTNMKRYSDAGGHPTSRSIAFKHNQLYLKDIETLCIQNGSGGHRVTKSDIFQDSENIFTG